jgi:hypothetical protein
MLKILPSLPNALRTTAEDIVYSLQYLAKNLFPQLDKRSSAAILKSLPMYSDALSVSPKLQTSDLLSRYII